MLHLCSPQITTKISFIINKCETILLPLLRRYYNTYYCHFYYFIATNILQQSENQKKSKNNILNITYQFKKFLNNISSLRNHYKTQIFPCTIENNQKMRHPSLLSACSVAQSFKLTTFPSLPSYPPYQTSPLPSLFPLLPSLQ